MNAIACILLILVLLGFAYLVGKTVQEGRGGADWRTLYGREQHRADRWRALFERQRRMDELSEAAARHEQHEIDRQARVLGFDVNNSARRIET